MADIAEEQLHRLLGAIESMSADVALETVLKRIVESACYLVGAKYGALGVLDERQEALVDFIAIGMDDRTIEAIGHLPQGKGILGLLIVDPKPLRLKRVSDHPDSFGIPQHHPEMNSFLGVPIRVRDQIFGNLYLANKQTADEFSQQDEQLVVALASAAGVAIDNARIRVQNATHAVTEDRERIARDLHDLVIQRLFAVGITLQGIEQKIDDLAIKGRLADAIENLDATVRQVRTTIFALDTPTAGLRASVVALVEQAREAMGFLPSVDFEGPVDSVITAPIVRELIPTIQELLTNVAKHSKASSAQIKIAAEGSNLELDVVDDGVGLDADFAAKSGRGLANVRERAELLGGSCAIESTAGRTSVRWRVPLS